MAIIPATEKVFMVSNGTNTTYGGSAALQAMNQWYTMQDIADTIGSVTLHKAASATYQTAAGALQSISAPISSSIFTDGTLLKLNAVITTTAASVAIVTIEFYVNNTPTMSGATLIGRYNGPIGNQYIPIDRFFWDVGTSFYGRDFTASASTSTSNSAFAINSFPVTTDNFYIITQVTTTSTDRACISSFQIEKS